MTSLRDGLHPPRRGLADDELTRLRSYLDGQSRIRLAAWASHEHGRVGGAVDYDDHLLLGIPGADFEGEDAQALDRGLEHELPAIHAWLDLFSLSDIATVREFAAVLWERGESPAGELDPLDFQLAWEPLDVPEAAVGRFAALLRAVAEVRRVEACRERLWKNGREMRSETQFYVDFDSQRPGGFTQVESALQETGLRQARNSTMTAGLPRDARVRTAVLYER